MPDLRRQDWIAHDGNYAGPRDFSSCKEEHGYDVFFQTAGIPTAALARLKYADQWAMTPQAVQLARQVSTADFFFTFGRPLGDFSVGPNVVNVPQAIPSRIPNPYLPSGGPLSMGAWVRSVAANIMRAAGK